MVLRAFLEEDGVDRGFFVDVGAYHPTRGSNTRYFYGQGCAASILMRHQDRCECSDDIGRETSIWKSPLQGAKAK